MRHMFSTIMAFMLMFAFTSSSSVFAQTGLPDANKINFNHLKPDPDKNEIKKYQVLQGNTVIQEITEYKEGHQLLKEFDNKTGLLNSEIYQDSRGALKLTRYFEDGKTKESTQTISLAGTDTYRYRKSGELWTHEESNREYRRFEYYPLSNHVVQRMIPSRGRLEMDVTVIEKKTGKTLYKQTWNSGVSGAYSLTRVEETTSTGEKRVVHLRGKRIIKADYLADDGSITRTESGDKLSEPLAESRMREFNLDDDPTAPRPRQLRGRGRGSQPSGPKIDPKPSKAPADDPLFCPKPDSKPVDDPLIDPKPVRR